MTGMTQWCRRRSLVRLRAFWRHIEQVTTQREWQRSWHNNYRIGKEELFRVRGRNNNRLLREKKFGVSYPTWWLCDICSVPISFSKGEIHLDHDHKTNLFRSWLCRTCNLGVGYLNTVELLKLATVWLAGKEAGVSPHD